MLHWPPTMMAVWLSTNVVVLHAEVMFATVILLAIDTEASVNPCRQPQWPHSPNNTKKQNYVCDLVFNHSFRVLF